MDSSKISRISEAVKQRKEFIDITGTMSVRLLIKATPDIITRYQQLVNEIQHFDHLNIPDQPRELFLHDHVRVYSLRTRLSQNINDVRHIYPHVTTLPSLLSILVQIRTPGVMSRVSRNIEPLVVHDGISWKYFPRDVQINDGRILLIF
jgi:hypothetical protein